MLLLPPYTRKVKINSLIAILLLFIFLYPVNAQQYQTHATTSYHQEYKAKYPSIDKLEQKVFGQVSKSNNIYERLNALETKVFKQTYNTELSQRVERLKIATKQNTTNNSNNLQKRLSKIEHHIFKQNYSTDKTEKRLARIESHYFGKSYADETAENRIDRIYTVLQVEIYKANNETVPNDLINKTSDGMKVISIIMFVAGFFL